MILIIGNMNKRITEFIKKSKFTERMKVINKMCNVKYIKEEVKVIVPFEIILNSGIISNTLVHLEELIITLNVKEIVFTNSYNNNMMNILSNRYNVPIKYINLNNESNLVF